MLWKALRLPSSWLGIFVVMFATHRAWRRQSEAGHYYDYFVIQGWDAAGQTGVPVGVCRPGILVPTQQSLRPRQRQGKAGVGWGKSQWPRSSASSVPK